MNNQVSIAAKIIQNGGVVVFPTETVYGLGADAFNPVAVKKIYQIKNRPSKNPLIVHISNLDQLLNIASDIPPLATKLIHHFWPGPLTLILKKHPDLPLEVTGGSNTVAVRMPDHPIALELINLANTPIVAPSANISGKPSCTTYFDVKAELDSKVDLIIDGGQCQIGLESTVLDLTTPTPTIWRPGAITLDILQEFVSPINIGQANSSSTIPSPGLAFKHYSPDTPITLVPLSHQMTAQINSLALESIAKNLKVGIITSSEHAHLYPSEAKIITLGSVNSLDQIAHNLFHQLNLLDSLQLDIVYAESLPDTGLGSAIMNRLSRAAAG